MKKTIPRTRGKRFVESILIFQIYKIKKIKYIDINIIESFLNIVLLFVQKAFLCKRFL